MSDMTADVASADAYDAVVDTDGSIWLRLPNGTWSYLSELTSLSWDGHTALPALYEPYRGLDRTAVAVIKAHVGISN